MRCYFKCKSARSYRAIGASGKSYSFATDKLTEVSDTLDIVHFRRNDMLIEHTPEGRRISSDPDKKPLSVSKFRSKKPQPQEQPVPRPVKRIEALVNNDKSKAVSSPAVAKAAPAEKPKRKRGRPRKNPEN